MDASSVNISTSSIEDASYDGDPNLESSILYVEQVNYCYVPGCIHYHLKGLKVG